MKRTPIVYVFFLISGMTALVYEIIWTRMLTLVFGHTVYSVSVVLAAFMAGLGFGSYLWGYAIDRVPKKNPLLIYGLVEILIFATCAVISLVLMADYWIRPAGLHLVFHTAGGKIDGEVGGKASHALAFARKVEDERRRLVPSRVSKPFRNYPSG